MEDSDDALLLEVAQLLVKATDNALSQREFQHLRNLLENNPAAREYYFDFFMTVAGIKKMEMPSEKERLTRLHRTCWRLPKKHSCF